MKHEETTHMTSGGAELYRQTWRPDDAPRAVLVLIHGLGEHSGRYGHLAQRFTDAGFAVFAMDLRGHGKSSGGRGDLRINDAVSDVADLVADASSEYPGLPVFLYGHSLGGLISMTYAVQRQPDITGLVASAPALDSELREQKVKFAMANLLGGLLPSIAIPTGLDADGVSRDPEVVAAYNADPLVHDKGSFALAKQTFSAMDAMMAQTGFPVPLLIIHGTADRLTVPSASKVFTDQVTGEVTLIEYEGMYHEPHNEPEQAEVFADVLEWLEPRIS
ncbi:MAG: lysophospholipase [Actinobacteria bacterium]|jgi:alpha-beta hydrolase superfamily lysophospholipase|nr:lysophospholipase [Actinomycetota bacterium]MCO5299694.1 lysophospholipase [Candidatus Nanopelagicales bacterium]MCB9428397.1 lysophospholipase [Actinomycetota bacterium]HPE11615.1 lysophospholipase [Actinomycetota bacterium]HPQ84490.1 lysophospholipase [Actinomycetota bacterium]